MERAEWMNAEVWEAIEYLRRTYGFEEREAIAYWHLSEASRWMTALAQADQERLVAARAREYEAQGLDEGARMGREIADSLQFGAMIESRISHHFEALRAVLGKRVLRRDYPEGWGWELAAEQGEEG